VTEREIKSRMLDQAAAALGRTALRIRSPLYRNALVLIVNAGVTAGLGFVFWALAARLYSPTQVGLASAAISGALFVGALSQLGLQYTVVRFGAGTDREPGLVTSIVLVVLAAATLGGVAFVGGLELWSPRLLAMTDRAVLAVILVPLAAGAAGGGILTWVAVAARDTRPAFVAGATQGVVKALLVVGLALLGFRVEIGIVLAWAVATGAAVGLEAWLLRRQFTRPVRIQLPRLRTYLRYSAGNYAAELAWVAPSLLYPLLVVGVLGAEENAYFYVAWAMAGLLAAVPVAIASSLLAEGSHATDELTDHLRKAAELTLALLLPAIIGYWVLGSSLLRLFGGPYAEHGGDVLRILAVAMVPLSVCYLHLTVARIRQQIRRVLVISLGVGAGSLVLSLILAGPLGVAGIALGYLAALLLVASLLTVRSVVLMRRARA